MEQPATEEPRALTMPPMVLLARTRTTFLLARASLVANNRQEWWGKIAIPLGSDATGGDLSINIRWVNYTMLTRLDGVGYSEVPTLPGLDDDR
ncbi:hypothetical protein [Nonomuraea zeae]|uniref:Uncharacterized protein n=1 Tax=Nonomuraea zeae TaxID=1642303 RepID=A0A5S4FY34_9ACTN|nr:hypothetical protein [Nonomuraea zeae]TMR25705.1 hypothetical protein ETD85_45065 [Nonomuraea zeae]